MRSPVIRPTRRRERSARHVVLFLRLPRPGRGKRRLAAGIGDVAAWRFAWRTGAASLAALRGPCWRLWLCLTPDAATGERSVGRLWPAASWLPRQAQGPGPLGRRMLRALARLPPGPALLVGGDVPDLAPRDLADAFAALDRACGRAELVLGPADDGGYWLIGHARRGTRRLPPWCLDGVRWSSADACADTAAALAPWGVVLAGVKADVDTAADLARLRARRAQR